MKLYKFQHENVENIYEQFKTVKEQYLANYTGSGKTNMFLALCAKYLEENPKMKIGISAFFQLNVKNQVYERAPEFLQLGQFQLLNGINTDCIAPVCIFNPQHFFYHENETKFDLLIIDESHYGFGESANLLRDIIKNNTHSKTKILHCSATPWEELNYKENPVVHKRGLGQGLKDGLIADFSIETREININLTEKDFTRIGDLSIKNKKMATLASICATVAKKIAEESLGKKILFICPGGDDVLVARAVKEVLGDDAFLYVEIRENKQREESEESLSSFKKNNKKYLIVVNKAQIGFDMPELETVVDFTMSRNIKTLVQRMGRIARYSKNRVKKYIYCYNENLISDQVQWIINTAIDFSLGNWDQFSIGRKKYFYAKTRLSHTFKLNETTQFSSIVNMLEDKMHIEKYKIFSFKQDQSMTVWDKEKAIESLKNYSNRTDLIRRNAYLYRWLKRKHKDILNAYFPYKHKSKIKWDLKKVLEMAKNFKSQHGFFVAYGGAEDFILKNNLKHELDKVLPRKYTKKNEMEDFINEALKYKNMFAFKKAKPGMVQSLYKRGMYSEFRDEMVKRCKTWRKHSRK